MPASPLPPLPVAVLLEEKFNNQVKLHVISWNACGITNWAKLTALKGYIHSHHPDVIFIQEAFVGNALPGEDAPSLRGYVSYVHRVRHGLVIYIHSSVQHRFLQNSVDDATTFQLLEVTVGGGTIRLCNVYSAPGGLTPATFPAPTIRGMVYTGDFNARHPALGDLSGTVNRNGTRLLEYIRRNQLTRWDTAGATHARGGTLDHILTCGLVPSQVKCSSVPALFSDHVGLSIHYSLPAAPASVHTRTRIAIPPKYRPTYISYMTNLLPTFDLHCPDKLYSSLVDATHAFYSQYVSRPHLRRRAGAHTWTLDNRIAQAERMAMEDGLAFQRRPSPETLHQYQLSSTNLVALQRCVQTDSWHKLTDSINHQTSVGSMWHLINKVVKKKPPSVLHHSPAQYAQDLINEWSAQSRASNLPAHIQDALSTQENYRALRLQAALLSTDEEDDVAITADELRRALARGKATSPGDDGITYAVLRALLEVPGNPLLQLYNLCLRLGYLPQAWTRSTIVPISKPGTDKFRPISLTSCVCKVLERILLSRLMFRLQDKLSPKLYSFLPQRGTHHCLMELYTRLSPASVVAFIDLKSAFDVANRDIILDQIVDFGVKGNLLRWLRDYLRNRTSRVLFKGALSTTKDFELGTPQGGVLSPFLFNIFMHRLLSLLPDVNDTTITCYADDICIHSSSPDDMQRFLHSFYAAASSCGLIISSDKSRTFSPRPARTLPEFTVGNNVIPLCTQYLYLGAPVRITPSIPARQRVHPIVQDLLARLQRRLTPLKWLTNYAAGVSIPVARTIYIAFIRSVIDYLSPSLCQLSKTTLQPLEKFQNQAMRLILGCPVSTRIVNMQHELRLPPLVERIYSNVTYFSIKCLHYPHISPHYAHTIRASLDPAAPRPLLRPGGRTLVSTICSNIRRLNINILAENVDHGFPPWQTPVPEVSYTPVTKTDLPQLQQQRALETIARLSSSLHVAHHLYTDGSLQGDGSAGCAVFSSSLEPPREGWTGRRLPNSSSSTYCELHGLLDAVTLLTQARNNGLIICDSQPALRALTSHKPAYQHLVTQILRQLATAHARSLVIHFLWIPSHIGLRANDTADRLARAACDLDPPAADAPTASLLCYRKMVRQAARSPTRHRRDAERATSASIQHYDHFLPRQHTYRRSGLLVRQHNVVCARLRLGWRPVWQVAVAEDAPHFSSCKLCDAPNANTLDHYCLECPHLANLIPQRLTLVDVCKHLLSDNYLLDEILMRYPLFGGC